MAQVAECMFILPASIIIFQTQFYYIKTPCIAWPQFKLHVLYLLKRPNAKTWSANTIQPKIRISLLALCEMLRMKRVSIYHEKSIPYEKASSILPKDTFTIQMSCGIYTRDYCRKQILLHNPDSLCKRTHKITWQSSRLRRLRAACDKGNMLLVLTLC